MRAPYSRTLFDLACEQAERYSDRQAVFGDHRSLTYSQLRDRAMGIAGGLRALGVERGDRVGLLLNNCPEWVEVCFGVAAIGAVLVPFSTWSRRRELAFLFRDSRIKVLISADHIGDQDFSQDIVALRPEHPELAVVLIGAGSVPGSIAYADLATKHPPIEGAPAPGDGARAEDRRIAD